MKILKEITEQVEFLFEAKEGGGKNYFLEGIFLQSTIRNRNGRIYPQNVLSESVDKYSREMISNKRSFGELNHPTSPSINLDKISHIITDLREDGNNFRGRAKILVNTPNGKIVQSLMDEGCVLGVSSRGLGAIKESKGSKIVESFYITTAADIVADPSGPDCFPENIVENIEWIFSENAGWVAQEQAVALVEDFKTKNRAEREAEFLVMFEKLLKL